MAADLHGELEALRPYLVRYAAYALRTPQAAEDAVQETLLAALAAPAAYAGRASLRTWLTGILKHKCIDVLRREQREAPLPGADAESAAGDFEDLFDEREPRPHAGPLRGAAVPLAHGAAAVPAEELVRRMNLSCRRATELLSQQLDRELSAEERAALKAHLLICRGCRAVDGQFRFLRQALRRLLRPDA